MENDNKITVTFTATRKLNQELKKYTAYRRQKSKVISIILDKIFEDLNEDEIRAIVEYWSNKKLVLQNVIKREY